MSRQNKKKSKIIYMCVYLQTLRLHIWPKFECEQDQLLTKQKRNIRSKMNKSKCKGKLIPPETNIVICMLCTLDKLVAVRNS